MGLIYTHTQLYDCLFGHAFREAMHVCNLPLIAESQAMPPNRVALHGISASASCSLRAKERNFPTLPFVVP